MQILRNIRRASLTMVEVIALQKRDQEEELELEKLIRDENLATSRNEGVIAEEQETVGRQTGTAEWKAARGEDGTRH